jgi:anti-sigma B factor antagonist
MSNRPAPSELRMNVEHRDEVIVTRLEGSATMDVSDDLQAHLMKLLETPASRVVVDLSGLDFVSSAGLGALVAAYRLSQESQGSLKVAAPRPAIRELLEMTRLSDILQVHDTLEEAISS